MELLQTQLSDSKQNVDQLESQLIKLQEDNKTLEAQLLSVQVGKDSPFETYHNYRQKCC